MVCRQDDCRYEDAEMQALAEALGAIATGPAATFWLYADSDGRWHVQREGEAEDHPFDKRDEALNFVRVAAARSASHRMILKAPQRRAVGPRRPSSPVGSGGEPALGWRRRLMGWWRAVPWQAVRA